MFEEQQNDLERLQAQWDVRAASDAKDYFVASHPGWNDPDERLRCARRDAENFFFQYDKTRLADAHLLEYGSGVGRLAPFLAEPALSYTGIDIAEGMINEARKRCQHLSNARFLLGNGSGLPSEARDREYELIVSIGVLIHCGRDVVRSILADAASALVSGGQVRFQLLADEADPEGLSLPPELSDEFKEKYAEHQDAHLALNPDDRSMAVDPTWMGYKFRYDEAKTMLEGLAVGPVTLLRPDPLHIYGWIQRA